MSADRAHPDKPNQTGAASRLPPSAVTVDLPPQSEVPDFTLSVFQPRLFGDYELLEEIARGGMGVVCKARQISLNRIVALKMILGGQFASPTEVQRFRTEAQAAANLDHPNIVPIYEVGECEGQHYFTMKLIEGGSLADALADRPGALGQHTAARLLATVARAVHHAHQHGTLHRDLKPANVLLSPGEGGDAFTPHITDFGLAKRMSTERGHTQSGAILGTPSYMAPEQATGPKAVTIAADVYSLGAILYELLTGKPPFQAETPFDTILQAAEREPVPPRMLNPEMSRDIETITLKCLEKTPARRYASAEELALDLERWLRGEPIQARPSRVWERSAKWVQRRPAVAALIGVTVLATAGLLTVMAIYSTRLSALVEAADAVHEQAKVDRTLARQASLAAEADRREVQQLRQNLAEKETQATRRLAQLTVADGVRQLERNDWRAALTLFTEALRLDQQEPDRVEAHRVRVATVWQRFPRLLQVLDAGTRVPLAQFSPDGKSVLTVEFDPTSLLPQARLWDAATGKQRGKALRHDLPVLGAAFSPDGQGVLTLEGVSTNPTCAARLWDAASGELRGGPFTLPHQAAAEWWHAEFSRDGRWFVTSQANRIIQIGNTANSTLREPVLRHDFPVLFATFSPDSRLLLTVGGEVNGNKGEVRLWNTESLELVRRMSFDAPLWCAAFSPDGGQYATGSGTGRVRVWDTASGEPLSPPLRHEQRVQHLQFSPDGVRLVTTSMDRTARVWEVGEEANPLVLKHDGGVRHAEFSPDGRHILTASDDGAARLWDAASGEQVGPLLKHADAVRYAAFASDGHRFLTAGFDGLVRLWDLIPAGPTVSYFRHDDLVRCGDFSPDGKWLVTGSSDKTARVWNLATGELRYPPLRHSAEVWMAAFSDDGRHVITGQGEPGGQRLFWDAATGKRLEAPADEQPQEAVRNGEPRYQAETHEDGVMLIDRGTGHPVAPRFPRNLDKPAAVLRRDAQRLLLTKLDTAAQVFDLTPEQGRAEDLELLAQLFTNQRLDTDRLTVLPKTEFQQLWARLAGRRMPLFTPATPVDVQAWHERMAHSSDTRSEMHGALWHLDRLVAARPQDAELYHRRGQAHSRIGAWQHAIDDYSSAIKLRPVDTYWFRRAQANAELGRWDAADADAAQAAALDPDHLWPLTDRALIRLRAGNLHGYRQLCAEILQRFRVTEDLDKAYGVAWICTLAPHAVADYAEVLRLAEKATGNTEHVGAIHTHGAALYRAGRFADALVRLNQAHQGRQIGTGDYDALYLAMTHHRLDHPVDALAWLEKARTLDELDRAKELSWDERAELRLLRVEAETLVKKH